MKKYCKDIDITDRTHVVRSILACLNTRKKRLRYDCIRLFADIGGISKRCATEALASRNGIFAEVVEKLADHLIGEMQRGVLRLRPVTDSERRDPSSGKMRKIALIHIKQLIYDHIACTALAPMMVRVGTYQCASLPAKGQLFGSEAVRRWMRDRSMRYAAKLDIHHCYESIDHGRMMDFLRRYIRNPRLLWLISELIDTCPQGLHIGSYLSQTLCTLYLADLYHEIGERMMTERTRRGTTERVQLVRHVLMYMDDILLMGNNKRHLHAAVKLVQQYCTERLGLTIKPGWRVFRLSETEGVDMMGYRMFKGHTGIRRRVFRRIRRCVLRVERKCREHVRVPVSMARRMASYAGYLMHSDSWRFCNRTNAARVLRVCAEVMSAHDRRAVKAA